MHPLLAGALLAVGAVAQGDNTLQNGALFIYPTKNQIYNKLDTVNVTYTSPFPSPNLFTFCSTDENGVRQISQTPAPGFNGTLPVRLNFTSGLPCWFNLRPGTQPGFGANSVPFTIIGIERASGSQVFGPDNNTPELGARPSASASTAASTTTVTSATSAVTSTDVAASSSSSSSPIANADGRNRGDGGGLGGGQSAGIVIGAIVGVLLVAGGLFWWWRKRRAAKKQTLAAQSCCAHGHDQHTSATAPPSYHAGGEKGSPQQGHSALHEGAQCVHCSPPGHQYKYATELSSTISPTEIGSSDHARPKYEMPA